MCFALRSFFIWHDEYTMNLKAKFPQYQERNAYFFRQEVIDLTNDDDDDAVATEQSTAMRLI